MNRSNNYYGLIRVFSTICFVILFSDLVWASSVSTPASEIPKLDTTESTKFMRAVYRKHVAWHKSNGRVYTTNTGGLSKVEQIELVSDAAKSLKKLLKQARTDLASDQQSENECSNATVKIFLGSGFRSIPVEIRLWRNTFKKTYNNLLIDKKGYKKFVKEFNLAKKKKKEKTQKYPDIHGPEAINYVFKNQKIYKAAPGYSRHSQGIAVDFKTSIQYAKVIILGPNRNHEKSWKSDSWLYQWLRINASTYGYVPYKKEAWHWEYRPAIAKKSLKVADTEITCNTYDNNTKEETTIEQQESESTQVEAGNEDVEYSQKLKELLAAMSGKEPDDVVEGDDDETADVQTVDEDQTSEKDELDESSSVSKNIDETKLGTLCDNLHKIKKEITSEDVNWLAKMLHGETAGKPNKNEASAMLWSLVQGQSTLIVHRKKGLGDYAQLYSQPINTLWLKKGRRCKTSYTNGKFNGLKNACSKTKVDRRVKYRNLAWDKISPVAQNAAIAFSEGTDSNNFIGSSGWYAKGLWKKREQNGANKTDRKVFFKEIDKNVFYATKRKKLDSTTWDGTEITIIDSSTICPYEEELEAEPEKKEYKSDGLIDPFQLE